MSRYTKYIGEGKTVEYGFDKSPTPGFFYDVFDEGNEVIEGGDTRSLCVIHPEKHMNRSEIAERLKELGAKEDHIEKMAMDLAF